MWGRSWYLVLVQRQEHKPCLFIICPPPPTPTPHSFVLVKLQFPPSHPISPPLSVHLHSFPVKQKSLPCTPNRKPLKGRQSLFLQYTVNEKKNNVVWRISLCVSVVHNIFIVIPIMAPVEYCNKWSCKLYLEGKVQRDHFLRTKHCAYLLA
jgi:hypothetical protein